MTMRLAALCAGVLMAAQASAAPVTYNLDPTHTYPNFSADHMGGLSVWRGKFRKSSGKVVLDREAKTGSVSITIDTASIDFGFDKMDEHARSPDMFDVEKFPTATYEGTLGGFKDGAPTEVQGSLTLHGVTKPVKLVIRSFLCKPNPMTKKEVCGADATATFSRADFGVSYGQAYGFNQTVTLDIQAEGVRAE
jgi:polyisoprenoid-binding protein YceI